MSDSETSTDFTQQLTKSQKKKQKKIAKDSNKPQKTIKQHILQCQQFITKIKEDKDTILSNTTQDHIEALTENLTQIQKSYIQLKKNIITLETELDKTKTRLTDHKSFIENLTDNLPNMDNMKQMIQEVISTEIQNQQTLINASEELKNQIMHLVPVATNHTQSHITNQTKQTKNTETRAYAQHIETQKTIVILPINKATFPTGKAIEQELQKQRVSYPRASVTQMITKKTHIEVQCRTPEEANCLLQDLKNDTKVNKIFNFEHKKKPLQKLILINVPVHIKGEHIKEALALHTKTTLEEFQILRNTHSKQEGTQNWILLTHIETAKTLTFNGGIYFGMTRCLIRPYTSVMRCRNCQVLGHSTNTCSSSPRCEICGDAHAPDTCNNTPRCINCHINNRDYNTTYTTAHTASDSSCVTYREYYNQERQKLDKIFNQHSIQQTSNKPELPPRFQEQRSEQQHNNNTEGHINNFRRQGLLPHPVDTSPQLHQYPYYPHQQNQQTWPPLPPWQHHFYPHSSYDDRQHYAQGVPNR